jgi:hypothetical protein
MDMMTALIYGFGALMLAVMLAASVLLALALPFMAWIETSRLVLWPVLKGIGARRQPMQFGLIDLGCLVAELSMVGLMSAQIGADPLNRDLAVFLLLIATVLVLSAWRLSVQWLGRTAVRGIVRRAVFQTFVVPVALFFPLLFGLFCFLLSRAFAGAHPLGQVETLDVVLGGGASGLVTLAAMSTSRRLAQWVAAASRPAVSRRT